MFRIRIRWIRIPIHVFFWIRIRIPPVAEYGSDPDPDQDLLWQNL
jgi:hypothetical protein